MSLLDSLIFVAYGLIILFVGNFFSRSKKGKAKDSKDYFFAGNSLPWYLIGTSIIAANISAEQFIGMSGSGYAIGLAIATYEWISALLLIIVAKFFLPVFIRKKIFTMPQFLAVRYNDNLKTVLAIFWIVLFIFVNLTSILYLGALSLKTIYEIKLFYGILGLAIFSLLYTITNGLKAIASTDIIQVFFLLAGGGITTYLALSALGDGKGVLEGIKFLADEVPDKLHMILSRSDPNYKFLPGFRAVFGGIWIAGIYYFGANQYIIQKALGAKDLREAQRGMVFAGFLKLILPLVVVIPGIVAFALVADISKPDEAYPWLLGNFVPNGLRGLVFAALIAAIVSSLSAIINSTSTIFTMDIYKVFINKNASEKQLVGMGRIAGVAAVAIAVFVAPLLGNLDQAFQFIQEYTGMISPGVVAIFVLGIFWKRTSALAAMTGVILSIPVSVILKWLFPDLPFLDVMTISFLILCAIIIIMSYFTREGIARKFELTGDYFRTDWKFNLFSIIIILILIFLYGFFW